MPRARRALAGAVAVCWLGPGCTPSGEFGFVSVRTTLALPPGDVLVLGASTLDSVGRGPAEATLKQAAGPAKLQVRRGGQVFDLCEVTVRPNRITTVRLVASGGRIGCDVDA